MGEVRGTYVGMYVLYTRCSQVRQYGVLSGLPMFVHPPYEDRRIDGSEIAAQTAPCSRRMIHGGDIGGGCVRMGEDVVGIWLCSEWICGRYVGELLM